MVCNFNLYEYLHEPLMILQGIPRDKDGIAMRGTPPSGLVITPG
jgi:hypothetical protein